MEFKLPSVRPSVNNLNSKECFSKIVIHYNSECQTLHSNTILFRCCNDEKFDVVLTTYMFWVMTSHRRCLGVTCLLGCVEMFILEASCGTSNQYLNKCTLEKPEKLSSVFMIS